MDFNKILSLFNKNTHLFTDIKNLDLGCADENEHEPTGLNDFFTDSIVYSIECLQKDYSSGKHNIIFLKEKPLLKIREELSSFFNNNCCVRLIYNKKINEKYRSFLKVNANNFTLEECLEIINKKNISSRFFLEQIDVSKDFSGSFDWMETRRYLKPNLTGFKFINDHKAGRHCLIFVKDNIKLKLYMKHYSQITNIATRTNIGNLIYNYIKPSFEYQRSLFSKKKFNEHGCTRLEITLYNCEKEKRKYWIDDLDKVFEFENIIKGNKFYSLGVEKLLNKVYSFVDVMNLIYIEDINIVFINYFYNSETNKWISLFFDMKKFHGFKTLLAPYHEKPMSKGDMDFDTFYDRIIFDLLIGLFGLPMIPIYLIKCNSIKNMTDYTIKKFIKGSNRVYFTKQNNLLTYSNFRFKEYHDIDFRVFEKKKDVKKILYSIFREHMLRPREIENDEFLIMPPIKNLVIDKKRVSIPDSLTLFEESPVLHSNSGLLDIISLSYNEDLNIRYVIKQNNVLKTVQFKDNDKVFEYIEDMLSFGSFTCLKTKNYRGVFNINLRVHCDMAREDKYFILEKRNKILLRWNIGDKKKTSINNLPDGYYIIESFARDVFRKKDIWLLKIKDKNDFVYRSNNSFIKTFNTKSKNQFYIFINGTSNTTTRNQEKNILCLV